MEQEHRITYKAGITRTPSDFLCQDGELAECINLVTDSEELKPMVQPSEYITSAEDDNHNAIDLPTILYIHKFTEERYIGYATVEENNTTTYPMVWGIKDGMKFVRKGYLTTDGNVQIYHQPNTKLTSIGKTLILIDDNGTDYFLWKENNYLALGDLPAPEFKFWLIEYGANLSAPMKITNSGKCNDMIYVDSSNMRHLEDGKQEEWNDLIVGLYSKNKRSIAQKKCFCEPFFVRGAIELYDGTYTHITQPILMLPYFDRNTECTDYNWNLQMMTFYAKLYFNQSQSYLDWADIVKGVVIFITDSVCPYDLSVDQSIFNGPWTVHGLSAQRNDTDKKMTINNTTIADVNSYYLALKLKDYDDYVKEIKSLSVFHRLCEIGINSVSNKDIGQYIEKHFLENISTQEMLEYDDWYSRSTLLPELVYAYNSRLNYANVKRNMFEGYGYFLPWDNNTPSTYTFYVKIRTDEKEIWVSHEEETRQIQGLYFYYPDSRATHVTIYKSGVGCICDKDLEAHQRLNGAYYFGGLPINHTTSTTYTESLVSVGEDGFDINDPNQHTDNDYKEYLPNYLIQSEVNNPWVFKAEGYHKVSIGRIMAISACTQALSQSQYGPYPLLVFSTNGIWNMSVDATGLYSDMQPISRDVLLNEHSVTQTDNAVFFVSKKGLMIAKPYRSTWIESVCVSEQMNGVAYNTANLITFASDAQGGTPDNAEPWKNIIKACQTNRSFLDYIRDEACFMAYDYIDSRILIINPNFGFSFAYHMADGTISKTILPAPMTSAVNNYPDYLIQGTVTETVEVGGVETEVTVQKLYSFYEKPREEEVIERSMAFVLTRPMKLAGPVSQASLRQLKNVGTWAKGTEQTPLSCVKSEVYLSSDMQTWYNDPSRFGAAARYYRLALFMKMLPTERLSGTILTEQERRNNNIR